MHINIPRGKIQKAYLHLTIKRTNLKRTRQAHCIQCTLKRNRPLRMASRRLQYVETTQAPTFR